MTDRASPGGYREPPAWLSFITGVGGDLREPIAAEHVLFRTAWSSCCRQPHWSEEEARGAYGVLFRAWPRRRGATDRESAQVQITAGYLMQGLNPESRSQLEWLAQRLEVKRDTLRKKRIVDKAVTWVYEARIGSPPHPLPWPRVLEGHQLRKAGFDQAEGDLEVPPISHINLPPGYYFKTPGWEYVEQVVNARAFEDAVGARHHRATARRSSPKLPRQVA